MFEDVLERDGWRKVSGPPPCCPGSEPLPCEHERALVAELDAAYAEQYDAALLPDPSLDGPDGSLPSSSAVLEESEHAQGLPLAFALEQLTLSDLDGGELVDAAAAWSRVIAWAEARRGEAAALLSAELHRLSGPIPGAGVAGMPAGSSPQRLAATELSMRLGMTRQSAERIVRTGRLLHGPLQATAEALEDGRIDQRKAELVADALEDVPLPIATAVEDAVLPTAGRRTHPQVTKDLAKALIAADAAEATTRRRRARSRRRVNHPRTLPDGMASISAVLPAEDAVALDLALDSVARTAKSGGDRRTLDQLRADALAAVGVDALRTGQLGRPARCRCPVRPASPTASGDEARSRLGAAAGAEAARPTPAVADGGPGPARPTPAVPDGGPGSARPTPADAPSVLGSVGGEPVRIHVTVPLNTLLGGAEPAELEGYGPIDPAAARALALGGTWRRLVTDPQSGTVLDVGRSRYRPPPDLARLVRARDRTCVRPGCGTRARSCDLDHTVPFGRGPDGGRTSLGNLGAECRTDHVLKTNGDFRVRQLPGGVFEWTSRTGHTYRREADGTITHRGRTEPAQPRGRNGAAGPGGARGAEPGSARGAEPRSARGAEPRSTRDAEPGGSRGADPGGSSGATPWGSIAGRPDGAGPGTADCPY